MISDRKKKAKKVISFAVKKYVLLNAFLLILLQSLMLFSSKGKMYTHPYQFHLGQFQETSKLEDLPA